MIARTTQPKWIVIWGIIIVATMLAYPTYRDVFLFGWLPINLVYLTALAVLIIVTYHFFFFDIVMTESDTETVEEGDV